MALSDLRYRYAPRTWVIIGIALLVVLYLAWLLLTGARAALELRSASRDASTVQAELASGNVDAARKAAADLRSSTGSAADRTDGFLFRTGRFVPFLGDDLDAVSVISAQLDRVADDVLPTVLDVASGVSLRTFSPTDGKVDLTAVEKAAPAIRSSDRVLADVRRKVDAIDTGGLIGRVRAPVTQLQDKLRSTSEAAHAADSAARLLPDMLGADGKRRYLLIIQNNAEARSLGGIPGSSAVIEASKGKVRMTRQAGSTDIRILGTDAADRTEGERTVLSPSFVRDLRDTTESPDFPRAAAVASRIAGASLDTRFDGVVSVDPVVLASLLRSLGAIQVNGFAITADNAVDALLHGVYVGYDKDLAAQDEFFEKTARAVFDRFVDGGGDPVLTTKALVQAATDRRVMVWSRRPAEERIIRGTGVSGVFPRGGSAPQVGVYLSDAAGGKMQYYLKATSTVRAARCLDDGRQELQVTTRLESGAPTKRSAIPRSVAGNDKTLRRGDMRLNVRIVAPSGGRITALTEGGRPETVAGGVLDGRQVAVVPLLLSPGQNQTFVTTMVTGKDERRGAVLTTTPGVSTDPTVVRSTSACG